MNTAKPISLRDVFQDISYAWDLLEAEVRLETSQSESTSGKDVANLLKLYMRGVEKMNTTLDIRESYFKNRMINMMSRPTVIKILNKPMTKKAQSAFVSCVTQESIQPIVETKPVESICPRRLDVHKEMQLKEKKQSMEMRVAYSAGENNPDVLQKILDEHSKKETIISSKIVKIVDSHEQKLKKRINDRKMKALTARKRSQIENRQHRSSESRRIEKLYEETQKNKNKSQSLDRTGSANKVAAELLKKYSFLKMQAGK